VTVSDVLYLTPEGAPQVFLPPADALEAVAPLADKKGYGFDGCSPNILMDRAEVKDGRIAFPGATSYRLSVLPNMETMRPRLLRKVGQLVRSGAMVVGSPPKRSPGLSNYPKCDDEVKSLALDLWGSSSIPAQATKRDSGNGSIYWGGEWSSVNANLYPTYTVTAGLLKSVGVPEDFTSTGPIRYGHRRTADRDIYFVASRSGDSVTAECNFRVGQGSPQWWNPVTGERRALPKFKQQNGLPTLYLTFAPFQSFFVVFDGKSPMATNSKSNFPALTKVMELTGSWEVRFDPKWGGPAQLTLDQLSDWTQRSEPGPKYYSGIAIYRKKICRITAAREKIHARSGNRARHGACPFERQGPRSRVVRAVASGHH
jgi:hypothetical protein